MEQNTNGKYPSQTNVKPQAKCRYGSLNLYHYKDPYGKTMQIVRPAIVKIKDLE